jgi:translation initiation factor 6 (eIF-6)
MKNHAKKQFVVHSQILIMKKFGSLLCHTSQSALMTEKCSEHEINQIMKQIQIKYVSVTLVDK